MVSGRARRVIPTDEFETVLAAGLHKTNGWGVVMLSGTGSFCKGRNSRGEEKHVGGWGPLVGDEGSGYDIAREAIAAAVRAHESRGPVTRLGDMILASLELDSFADLKKRLYRPPIKRHVVAGLAPLVFEAAEAGDAVAGEILDDCARRLRLLATPVLEGLFGADERFPIVLSGGVLRRAGRVTDALVSELKAIRPRANAFVPALQPVTGALIIGLGSMGVALNQKVISNLARGGENPER
jgi:N-acetylglucosamine kinase